MYKNITLSFMSLNFKSMIRNFVKKTNELKSGIKLFQNSFQSQNFNIKKEKQIMHASYDISLEIA